MLMRKLFVTSLAVLAVVAVGCSSSSPPASTTSAPRPSTTTGPQPSTGTGAGAAYCPQVQAAKDSLNTLVGTKILAEGTNTLKTRFEAFTNDLASLKTAIGSQLKVQVDAVQASVDALKAVVDNAGTAGAAATAAQFAAGLGALKTTTQALFASLGKNC